MCIAIYKPNRFKLTDETLNNCWENNQDGAGFAYRDKDGEVVIERGFMKLKALKKALKKAGEYKEMAIHFRIGTHGAMDESNTHPFALPGGSFMHNGILSGHAFREKDRSDTRIMAEDILVPLFKGSTTFGQSAHEKALLEAALDGSKGILFMKGWHLILNEDDGVWHSDCWFSNTTFNKRAPMVAGYTTNGYNYGRIPHQYYTRYYHGPDGKLKTYQSTVAGPSFEQMADADETDTAMYDEWMDEYCERALSGYTRPSVIHDREDLDTTRNPDEKFSDWEARMIRLNEEVSYELNHGDGGTDADTDLNYRRLLEDRANQLLEDGEEVA